MGNCLRLSKRADQQSSSSMVWADFGPEEEEEDGWVSAVATTAKSKWKSPEKQGLLDDDDAGASTLDSESHNIHKEVKIKISKKQLEKLLGEVDIHGMPVDQLLSSLINAATAADADADLHHHHLHLHHEQHSSQTFQHQRSWRPRLQSIPEFD